jgi:hypothetical protein
MNTFYKSVTYILTSSLILFSQPTSAVTSAAATIGSNSNSTQVNVAVSGSNTAFSLNSTHSAVSSYAAGRAFASNTLNGYQTAPGYGFYHPTLTPYVPYYTAPSYNTGLRWQQERLEEELREARRIEQKEMDDYQKVLSKETRKAMAEHAQLLQENANLKQRLEGNPENHTYVYNVAKSNENPEGEIRIHRASTANATEISAKSNRIMKNAQIEHHKPEKCLRYAIKEFRKESEILKIENESLKAKLEQQEDYRVKSFPSE